jgi:hypothetical protein
MKLTGENRSTRGKTCPSATLSTTNPTWTDPGLSPGLRGERLATNRLSHGTARPLELVQPEWYLIGSVNKRQIYDSLISFQYGDHFISVSKNVLLF